MSSDSPSDSTARSIGKEGQEVQPDVPPSGEPSDVQPDTPPRFERCNVLILSFLSFCLIGFSVWLVSAGKRYREEYAQATQPWRVGDTRMVELTLVKDDKRNLACASDEVLAGLHCGYQRD